MGYCYAKEDGIEIATRVDTDESGVCSRKLDQKVSEFKELLRDRQQLQQQQQQQ
jgi:hypothetical protein